MSTSLFFFFFNDTATTEIYTLSLHDALPISTCATDSRCRRRRPARSRRAMYCGSRPRAVEPGETQRGSGHELRVGSRSEEHTSELQSPCNLVCRLLLEKKKNQAQ